MSFLKRFSIGRTRKKKSVLVRDAGATESELTRCKSLSLFRDKFVEDVCEARSPQALMNVVEKFKSKVERIVLPSSRVADIDQVRKDAQRDSMIINGKLFEQSDADPLEYLAENIERSRSPSRRGSQEDREDKESLSRSRRFARQILMTSSRTVSGSDSFFVCHTLFRRDDFHLTPCVHEGEPTIIRVDARGTLIDIKCTNTYKITTHNTEEESNLTGVSVMEWITLKTVIEQKFYLPVQDHGRLNAGERVMSITLKLGDKKEKMKNETVVAIVDDGDSSDVKTTTNEMKVLRVSCNDPWSSPDANNNKKKDDDEEEVDLALLKLPPPPRKTSRRSTSRSPSRSPKYDKGYKVVFSSEGPLGLGYQWTDGIGPRIKALRPNSQADGRVRIGDVVSHINGKVCPTNEKDFKGLLAKRPLIIRFRKKKNKNKNASSS